MNSKQLLNTKNSVPVTSKVSIAHFYNYCLQKAVPFAFYRLPDTDKVNVIAQKTPVAKKLSFSKSTVSASGFVFAPFTESRDYYKVLIAPDIACTASTLPALNFAKTCMVTQKVTKQTLKETGKSAYKKLVHKISKQATEKKFSKVIAARVIKTQKPADFDVVNLFTRLCKKYPHAFVSLVYTNEFGLWIGASPEILLKVEKGTYKTYSLAGTKANNKENLNKAWGIKELDEQAIVTKYITKELAKVTEHPLKVTGPETTEAGNLLHLRTTISYKGNNAHGWQSAVKALHPTPAVAGLPKQKAIDFILKHEKAPRSFYSGYLGPVNLNGQINLYVNLRCMQVLKNKLAVYVGCGVTASSNPELEWRESKIKSETLLSVLKA